MRKKSTLVALLFIFAAAFSQKHIPLLDILIKNTTVVDVVNKRILSHKNIGLLNGNFEEITDSVEVPPAKRYIDGSHYIALPGFVDTHTHLWQHICKSCYPAESLQKWIRVYRAIHYLTDTELYNVVLAAANEAILSGVTTVSDYASLGFNDYAFEVNANSIRDAGLGGVIVWHNPSIFLPDSVKLLEIQRLQAKYKKNFSVWMGQGPLSFHTLPQVYSGIRIAQKLNMSVTEHTMENNQEQKDFYDYLSGYVKKYGSRLTVADKALLMQIIAASRPSNVDGYEKLLREAKDVLKNDSLLSGNKNYKQLSAEERSKLESLDYKRRVSPLELLDSFKILKNFLSIHSVWPEQEDLQIMKDNNISISHNPESNMYLSSGVAPIIDYLEKGILVTLGTDGAASNDGINFFSAMREMWNAAKIRAMNPEISGQVDEWTVLQAATINGAKALKMEQLTGSIETGKEADLILVSTDDLGMSPVRTDKMIALLIYSGNSRNVKYVFSDGKMLVENGKLTRYNEPTLARSLTKIANAVDERIVTGKIWADNYLINRDNLVNYWYKYRSVRSADSIHLSIVNKISAPLQCTIISSAATFGGGTPYVTDTAVQNRFPENPMPLAFKEVDTLAPGGKIYIMKRKKGNTYNIQVNGLIKTEVSDIGQLLIIANKITQ